VVFFKYSYKKYLSDIEWCAYRKDAFIIIQDIAGSSENETQFIMRHYVLMSSYFYNQFNILPQELTKIASKEHLENIKTIFVKNIVQNEVLPKPVQARYRHKSFLIEVLMKCLVQVEIWV